MRGQNPELESSSTPSQLNLFPSLGVPRPQKFCILPHDLFCSAEPCHSLSQRDLGTSFQVGRLLSIQAPRGGGGPGSRHWVAMAPAVS